MKAKFYVATLAAAVERAARIAPNKGVAFDKAAGIVLHIDAKEGVACLMATDLEVYYREEVRDVVEYGDEAATWRLPSTLFAGIMAGLPLDKEVSIEDDGDRRVLIKCGPKKAKLRTLPHDLYPQWERVEDEGMLTVPSFAARVAQVAWAVDKDRVPFTGVHVDGQHLNATDSYKLARVPCVVPLEEKVTVAISTLAPILRNLPGDVRLAATDKNLLIRVGDEVEARCVLIEKNFPDLGKVMRDTYSIHAKVNREALIEAIQSMLVLVKNERYPRMHFDFEEGAIHIFMNVPETGDMADVIEAEMDEDMAFSIDFTPTFILKALEAATTDKVLWSLGPDKRSMCRIQSDDYTALVMPLSDLKKED